MSLHALLLFAGMELLFSATPGPAVMLVSAQGFRGGLRAALLANAGIQTGNAIYIMISALGLGAIIAASAGALTVIKLLGAGYLIFLGVRTIWRARVKTDRPHSSGRPYIQALLTQLGNPKAVLFFGAFLPQFLDPHAGLALQYAQMFAIIMVGETLILGFYGWLATQGARLVSRRFAVWRERIGGAIFIAIGAIFRGARVTPAAFIRANAVLTAPPLVPEIQLYLATEVVPLWRKTEEELAELGVPPPYWAFAWAGGQALARYVLDHPEIVAGKRVLDFGAGSGLVALAAARAGAAFVLAADIDKFAIAAIAANADANTLALATTSEDVIGSTDPFDVILVGDMCYERPLAERLMAWLLSSRAEILLGDPGRSYFPKTGLAKLAHYSVTTTRELEDREIRETGVWRLTQG